jgi:hypothetical protein
MIIANSLLKEYGICHFAASFKHLSREASVSTSPRTSHATQNMADVRPPENVTTAFILKHVSTFMWQLYSISREGLKGRTHALSNFAFLTSTTYPSSLLL